MARDISHHNIRGINQKSRIPDPESPILIPIPNPGRGRDVDDGEVDGDCDSGSGIRDQGFGIRDSLSRDSSSGGRLAQLQQLLGLGEQRQGVLELRVGPGEVLVSSTVRDLVAGSGIPFEERGRHSLKGVPGEWLLFAVAAA